MRFLQRFSTDRPNFWGWRRAKIVLLAAAIGALQSLPAAAAKRVALVVGNSAYAHATHLDNPSNDAKDMASALQNLGFEVIPATDLTKAEFERKLRKFSGALAGADVGLFFYAGHALQAKGVNHLIPIDATLDDEYDLKFETVTLDLVLDLMKQAKTRLVILDACRNNPFARSLARSMGSRSIGGDRGLAISVASGLGTFIAYATQPGNTASDGQGRNSPFTGPLKVHIREPGVSLTDLMILVRHDVVTATNGEQVPWDHSALLGKFYFSSGATVEPDPAVAMAGEAAEAWGWIKNTTDMAILDEFIRRFGGTDFGERARQRRADLKRQHAEAESVVLPDLRLASLRPVQPSYDCKVHYKDAEVTICNNPELSMLDNELNRVYMQASKGQSSRQRQALVSAQRQWLEVRNNCTTDVQCLAMQYRTRIKELGSQRPSETGTLTATAQPSFDCAKHFLPAEVAICNDAELARLDSALDRSYTKTARSLSSSRRKALVLEQRQWLRGRDTCGSNQACIKLQYEARLAQLDAWR